MSLMLYASVSSGVVYSHANKKVYTETPSTWTMNHENIISSNYGSGFCNSHFIKCSRVGLYLLKKVKLLAGQTIIDLYISASKL